MNIPEFEPLKVPEKGFVVFGKSEPWKLNACLHFTHDMQYAYEEGYKKAAEVLIEYVVANERHQDILVYPIVFLLRQRLELQLKSILSDLVELNKRKGGIPMVHDLSKLWNECKTPILEFIAPEDRKWLEPVGVLMQQISEVDSGADAFRFKTLRDGRKSAEGILHINLLQLYYSIDPISTWLDSVSSYLGQIRDYYNDQKEYQ